MGFINAIFIAVIAFNEGYIAIGILSVVWSALAFMACAAKASKKDD